MLEAGRAGGRGAPFPAVRGAGSARPAGQDELRKQAASKRITQAATPIKSALIRGPVAAGRQGGVDRAVVSGPASQKLSVAGQSWVRRLSTAKQFPMPGQRATALEGADPKRLTGPTNAAALRAVSPIRSALVRQKRTGAGGPHDSGERLMAASPAGRSAPQGPFTRSKAVPSPVPVPSDASVAGLQKAMAAFRQTALKAAVPARSALVRRRARPDLGPRRSKSGSEADLTKALWHPTGHEVR
jgi:hypothetical protein